MGSPDDGAVTERRAARVLLLDADDRVLLFHGCDPADASAGHWWLTPGGGLDPGESPAQAAARELAEETGLRVDPEELGAPVHSRTARFRFAGGSYRQSEDFFLLRVTAHEVDSAGFTPLEVSAVLGHRWWPRAELRTTDERVYPVELPDVLDRVAEVRAPRPVVRRENGLWAFERVLQRCGFSTVAGVDEAGRGACAGPLVVAAVVLPPGARGEVPGLADSKLLTSQARERAYAEVVRRASAWSVVVVPPAEVDRCGLHVMNVRAMRQAVTRLAACPSYVLTDGFPVAGMPAPSLAVWKGDRVAACVAAASVVAKVTRDRMMAALHERHPEYDFARHKGYATPEHGAALAAHGPCAEHRFSYVNVRAALPGAGARVQQTVPESDELLEASA